MEKLIQLLLLLVNKAPFSSETDHDNALDLLREVADEVGGSDQLPPKPGATNAPVQTPDVDPGPVAEPVPADEQLPPPTSPEVAGASPEKANMFSADT